MKKVTPAKKAAPAKKTETKSKAKEPVKPEIVQPDPENPDTQAHVKENAQKQGQSVHTPMADIIAGRGEQDMDDN